MSENNELPVEQVKELLNTVADWLPKMIKDLKATLFSPEAGRELGAAVGAFYKELVENGIPADDAMEMAKSYMGTLKSAMEQAKWSGGKE